MYDGWIKLPKDLTAWRWFDNPDMIQLWLYLLAKAESEDREWHNLTIRKGQLLINVGSLSKELGQSEWKVRNGLKRLQSVESILLKATNRFTVITINHYDDYLIGNQTGIELKSDKESDPVSKTKDHKDVIEEKEIFDIEEVEEYPFLNFWDLYDKKIGRPKCEKLWAKLSNKERKSCMGYIGSYIKSQPEKRFRKNPETFLRNKSWEDEIVDSRNNPVNTSILTDNSVNKYDNQKTW